MNNHKCLTNTNTSKTLHELLFYVTNTPRIKIKYCEGVSRRFLNSETQMSLDKTVSRRSFLEAVGKALGGAGAAAAVSSLPLSQAFAGDAKEAGWTPELRELFALHQSILKK